MRNFPTQYPLQSQDAVYFPHIPKTAGMTFRTLLEDQFRCDDICPATLNAQFAKLSAEQINQYRLFRGHLSYIDIPRLVTAKRLLNVTVLREPIARVISHYDYIRRTPGDPHHQSVMGMTLEEFAQKLSVGRIGKNVQVYYIAKLAKYELNRLSPQEILDLAKQSLDQFAFVGLLEQFQDSLFLLSYIFGWKPILNSRKENVSGSSKAKLWETLPASTLAAIQENTLLDQELYTYAQEIFATRFDDMVQSLVQQYANQLSPEHQASLQQDPLLKLPPEVTNELLNHHTEQRFIEQNQPQHPAVQYDFCEPIRGTGWQRRECPENAEDAAYRWIGPEPIATLDLPLTAKPDTAYFLELRVISTWVVPSDVLNSLTLTINGQPIALETLYRDTGVKLMRGRIPYAAIATGSPFVSLKLQINRVVNFQFSNLFNPDPRLIGLAFNYIHLFPVAWEAEKSASLLLFKDDLWQQVSDFVQSNLKPDEVVAAPLAFSAKLPVTVVDYNQILQPQTHCDWVILHKGMTERAIALVAKLFSQRFEPVYSNEVFIVFARDKSLPSLGYASSHVRSLYLGRIKGHVQFFLEKRLVPWYMERFGPKQVPVKIQKPPTETETD
jgi:hypothetical protein